MQRKQAPTSPADFCLFGSSPEHRLSHFERLTMLGGQELRRAIERLAPRFAQLPSQTSFGLDPTHLLHIADRYSDPLLQSTFFPTPSSPAHVERHTVHGLPDGLVEDLTFRGDYPSLANRTLPDPLLHESNRTVHARWWRHHYDYRATVVALHGWTMGDQRISALTLLPGVLYRNGFDVVVVELPLHGRRSTQQESAYALPPAFDLSLTNDAIAQAVTDIRQLRLWLLSLGCHRIGCLGLSLGGYVNALLASLDRWDFAVPLVPAVNLAEIVLTSTRHNLKNRRMAGQVRAILERAFAIHSPLNRQLALDKRHVMLVAGLGDRVVPAKQPRALWEHWGRPEVRWHRGGHAVPFSKTRVFEEVMEFIGALWS
ncbi:MAG: alpha/beta hydrolase [Bdellovibrionota bacterium]|nr:MAG: alpha/beta hydrolase [Bdellovibrionota bacterium]